MEIHATYAQKEVKLTQIHREHEALQVTRKHRVLRSCCNEATSFQKMNIPPNLFLKLLSSTLSSDGSHKQTNKRNRLHVTRQIRQKLCL